MKLSALPTSRVAQLGIPTMLLSSAVFSNARAALPALEEPSRGAGAGIMETIQNYGFDIVTLVSLLVISAMFVGVCYHGYTSYAEIHTGRKTWGDFGLTVAIGAVLLVLGIWLLTTASDIL